MKTRMKNRAERRKSLAARILAIGGIAALVVVMSILSAQAEPALSNSGGGSWQYYRDISVTENSGNALSAYQVIAQLSSSNFPTSARSDGADIRFTDANGNELSYWVESWDYSGKIAKIWVKVPSIPASAIATIRMYYGNPSASSSGNGDATFELFDDFNGATIDTNKWNIETPTRVSGGVLYDNKYTLRLDVSQLSNTEVGLYSKSLLPQSRSFHAKVRDGYSEDGGFTWSHSSDVFGFRDYNNKRIEVVSYTFGDTWKGLNYNDSPYSVCELKNPRPRSNWIEITTTRYFDKSRFSLIESASGNINNCNILDYITNNNLPVVLSSLHSYSYINKIFYVDWVYITKFVDPEPTLSIGAEQPISSDATPPTISITSPASGQTFNTNTITVNGTASDNIGMSKVEIKVGSGNWNFASGTNSWSGFVTLSSGSNVIYARATDTSGNTGEAWVTAEYLTPTPTETVTPTPTQTVISTPAPKQPLLTISQTTLKEEPEVGEEVLITVSLQNIGDATARNIRLTEQIPSSIAVSFIDGANKPGNLVTWEGELAPNRAHAIVHTIQIVEKKDRSFPVIIRYEDEAGNLKETSSMVYVKAYEPPTPAPTPVWTKAPEKNVQEVKLPGFTAPMVLIGFVVVVLLARRR